MRVTVDIDKQAAKRLDAVLAKLAKDTAGKNIQKAVRKSSKPLYDGAKITAKQNFPRSKTIDKGIQNVKGRYSRDTNPYQVIQHRDKLLDTVRIYAGYRAKRQTNWSKIGHIVDGGTNANFRYAGSTVRQATSGRKRRVSLNQFGQPSFVRRNSGSGRNFVVMGANGPHPIRKINHPGTDQGYYWDKALRTYGPKAQNDFTGALLDVLRAARDSMK